MHTDHRQTDTVTERGRQETDRQSETCRQTHAHHRQREAGKRHTEICRQMHADHRHTDAVTERGRQETHREMQTDAC